MVALYQEMYLRQFFYEIRPFSNGIHGIYQVDQSQFPEAPGLEAPAPDPVNAGNDKPMVGAQDSG
jgi:hypothetical protein